MTLVLLASGFAVACSGSTSVAPTPTPSPDPGPVITPTPTPSAPVTFVGAGDIADCTTLDGGANAEATAKLIDRISDGVVFTAGDNAYFSGTAAEFQNCYGPRWGRFRNRTRPSPGNHEYNPPSFGIPYFDYFGDRAGPRGAGFYSYRLGNWHIVSLNSNVPVGPGSEQLTWLRQDLESNKLSDTARCTLAYWHHPLFTSGPSAGSNALMRPTWQVLYEFGVDVVVNGHDHLYERFDWMDPTGRRDSPNAGIRQYIVGTGGAPLYDFGPRLPTSLAGLKAYGVVKFTLRDTGWDSVFIQTGSEVTFDLSLENLCH
jgi:calcineurin-like phosphoesterase family protein